jgi:hypothetical protein
MRFNKWILMLLAVLAVSAHAASTVLIGSLSTVSTATTNSPSVNNGSTFTPAGTFVISATGLTQTNQVALYEQVSFDGTNFMTIGTNYLGTNNLNLSFRGGQSAAPVYTRISVSCIASNFNIGGTYIQ